MSVGRKMLLKKSIERRREAVMRRARGKVPSTHYLLVGSAVAGECFLDRDKCTFVLRLKKGTSLNWRDRLRLLPASATRAPSPLPAESVA
jgi:hypothetical protein